MNRMILAGVVLVVVFAQGTFGWLYYRSVANIDLVKKSGVCDSVKKCQDQGYGDYHAKVLGFRHGEVYDSVDNWCPQKKSCWDDKCDDIILQIEIALDRGAVEWICNNKEGFKNTTCYQPPFTTTMMACLNTLLKEQTESTDFTGMADRFETCVLSSLDTLPGCSKDNAFADLFKYIMASRRFVYGI